MTTTLPPSGDTPAELAEHLASGARLVEAFHLMPGVARAMREAARLLRKPCTCHPDDNPPRPCQQKYALSECRAAPPADDDTLEFVERWAVHHVKTQGADAAIGVIANHPAIKAITKSLGEQTPPYPADDEAVRLLREARQCVHEEASYEREIEGRGYYCELVSRIDAYLAKKGKL